MSKVFTLLLLIAAHALWAQNTTVSGVVVDQESGETIPFASIKFQNTTVFTTTDIDGNFSLSGKTVSDTLEVGTMGYEVQKVAIKQGQVQEVRIELMSSSFRLEGVSITVGENPAFQIMRRVIENRPLNKSTALDAYQFESYSKVELQMDNITEKFKEKKLLRKANESLQTLHTISDEHGNQVYPMFISETISDFYYNSSPKALKEYVKATKVSGLAITDGSLTSQFVGASFQQFDFYENSLSVLDKEFLSPIGNSWKSVYVYYLEDSLMIDGRFCYEIAVEPKRPQDLAFVGNIWVDKETYALKRVDLRVPKEANLNFIEEIKVRRSWKRTEAGPWLPERTALKIDVSELSENMASMIVKSSATNRNFVVNDVKEDDFFEYPIEVAEDAQDFDNSYWKGSRPDSLTDEEKRSFALIDTMKNLPVIRTYLDVFDIVVNGYKRIGKVDVGPYLYSYAYNNIEGSRIRLGFKTNYLLSKEYEISGYAAYGTRDGDFKYSLKTRFILGRKPWTELTLMYRHDIDQLGVTSLFEDNLFEAFTRWGTLTGPFYNTETRFTLFRQMNRHFSGQLGFSHRAFDPLFNFGYYPDPSDLSNVQSTFETSELSIKARFAFNEINIISDNSRISMGARKAPIVELKYTAGIKDLFNSDFSYNKLDLVVNHRVGMGKFGYGRYWLQGGKVFGTVPYPLLNVHLGNQTPFYNSRSFNVMDYFEFVSDRYTSLTYVHHFEGLILNRIPLMKKLKWRTVVNGNILYGWVGQPNFDIIPPDATQFSVFTSQPYTEVGYGLENIFRIIRVQMFHRLTYRQNDSNNWGIKATAQFTL